MSEKKDYLKQLESGNIRSKEEQVEQQQDKVDLGKESIDFMQQEFDLIEELQPIVREGLEVIEPTKKFELNPRYWEIQKELAKISHLRELNAKKSELERTKKIVKQEEEKLKEMKGE